MARMVVQVCGVARRAGAGAVRVAVAGAGNHAARHYGG